MQVVYNYLWDASMEMIPFLSITEHALLFGPGVATTTKRKGAGENRLIG